VATSPEDGLARLAREPVDLVVQDMNFQADTTSGEEGVALFEQIRARHPDLPVILLTAWTHLESAVDLVKAGAADYLAKPWDDRKLLATVNNLLELSQARRVGAPPRRRPAPSQRAGARPRPARLRLRRRRHRACARAGVPGRPL
jgi:DNA-binding NtrC family response regulator